MISGSAFRLTALATVAGVLAAALLGLSAPAGKSGERRTLTLDLAVPDALGSPGAAFAQSFARAVAARSGGSLRIRISASPSGTTDPDDRADAAALAAVRSKRSQLAIVPAESLPAIGVSSFAALDVPFLIDTDALAAQVTTGSLAARLQSGLPGASLTGLGLIPETLYRPFGFLKPLLTPADFAGVEVRAPRSTTIRAVLRALGARPVASDRPGPGSSVLAGFVDEAPSGSDHAFPQNAYTAANLAVLPKIDVVVGSAASIRGLSSKARKALREAAAEVRRQAIAAGGGAEAEVTFCRNGGTVVAAPSGAASALRSGAESATVGGIDPETRLLIARIRRLAATGPATTIAACSETAVPSSVPGFGEYARALRNRLLVPDGMYRHVFPSTRLGRTGVATLVVSGAQTRDFRFFELEWQGRPAPVCRGRIGVVIGKNLVRWNPLTPCSGRLVFTWHGERGDVGVDVDGVRSDHEWAQAFAGVWKLAYPAS